MSEAVALIPSLIQNSLCVVPDTVGSLATIAAQDLGNHMELIQFLDLNSQRLAAAVETSLHQRIVDETNALDSLIAFTQNVSSKFIVYLCCFIIMTIVLPVNVTDSSIASINRVTRSR